MFLDVIHCNTPDSQPGVRSSFQPVAKFPQGFQQLFDLGLPLRFTDTTDDTTWHE